MIDRGWIALTVVALSLSGSLLTGCAAPGERARPDAVEMIEISQWRDEPQPDAFLRAGVTTLADARRLLGAPFSVRDMVGGGKVAVWRRSNIRGRAGQIIQWSALFGADGKVVRVTSCRLGDEACSPEAVEVIELPPEGPTSRQPDLSRLEPGVTTVAEANFIMGQSLVRDMPDGTREVLWGRVLVVDPASRTIYWSAVFGTDGKLVRVIRCPLLDQICHPL